MSSVAERLAILAAFASSLSQPVDTTVAVPPALPELPELTPDQRIALMRERQGHLQLREAFKNRDPHRAAKPSGVWMRDRHGLEYAVCDDGSIRKPYKRVPGLSGRQFRKLRKWANKAIRARERDQQAG